MARTEAELIRGGEAATPPTSEVNGTAVSARSERTNKALALTDAQGRRALAWRKAGAWIVESDDPAFKRRVQRAIRKPVWVREDLPGPDGERWSALIELRPGDPRHARQLIWTWHQLGLDDVQVDIVSAPIEAHGAAIG
jgi:hypothetical protein